MKKTLLLLSFLFFAFGISYAQFTVTNDAKKISEHCFRITPKAGNMFGTVWFNEKLNLSQPIELDFTIFMGDSTIGADGIAFVMHNDARGFAARGEAGGGLGFGEHPSQGTRKIFPSVAIEFDTYQNNECNQTGGEPIVDHTTVVYNGATCSPEFIPVQLKPTPPYDTDDVEDKKCYSYKIRWDPILQELSLFIDGIQIFKHNDDVIDKIFNGETQVYYGFTGSTGGSMNEQTVCILGTNSTPVANYDVATTTINTPVNIAVLSNDQEEDGDELVLAEELVRAPLHGTVVKNNGAYTYIPNAGFIGIDDFVYRVCDVQPDACYANCDEANVSVKVGCDADCPAPPWTVEIEATDATCSDNSDGKATADVTGDFGTSCEASPAPPVTCSTGCDLTISNNQNFTVEAGQQVCLKTTNYSGNINFKGGTLVVCGSTTPNVNFNGGSGKIINLGALNHNHLNLNQNFSIVNYGTIQVSSNITGNGNFTNYGVTDVGSDFNVHGQGEVYNTGTISVGGSLNNSSSFINSGNLVISRDLRNQGGGSFRNNCTIEIGQQFFNNGNSSFANAGKLFANGGATLQGNSLMVTYPSSEMTTPNLSGNGEIRGEGGSCSSVVVGNLNQSVNASGNVNVCQQGNTECICDVTEPPCTYLWSSGDTTPEVDDLEPGTYTVTITCNGQSVTETVVIEAPDEISIVVDTREDATCSSSEDGSVDLTVTGGTGPYTYQWSDGSTTEDLGGLSSGTYTVVVTDTNGCESEETISISSPDPLAVAVTVTGNIANANTTGGTAPYSYSWSNGATGAVQEGLENGTYWVTVTDANGCTFTEEVIVGPPDSGEPCSSFSISLSANGPGCDGNLTGWVNLRVSGGKAPFTYLWNTGATTEDITELGAGTYAVVVSDINGCEVQDSVTLSGSGSLTATIQATEISCHSAQDGSLDLIVAGGTPPFVYEWNTGATTEDIDQLSAGTYTVIVRDSTNCTTTASVNLEAPEALVAEMLSFQHISCYGSADGNIEVDVNGGVAPYTFLWSNGLTTQNAEGLVAGAYNLTVTDSTGCTATLALTLQEPPAFTLTLLGEDVNCATGSNGSVIANIRGGVGPFQYNWSNGATTKDLYNLEAGDYTLTVTDVQNCTASGSVTIASSSPIQVIAESTPATCFGAENGSVSVTVSQGVPPYTYQWSHGPVTADLNGVGAGVYSLTVTDALLCSSAVTVNVEEPAELTVTVAGDTTTLAVTAQGGTAPYTYQWSTGGEEAIQYQLAPGVYQVTVTDAAGCTAIGVGVVGTEGCEGFSATIQKGDITCFGGIDGSANLMLTGGAGPFTYQWSNGAATEDINNLSAGTYSVIVTDTESGCVASASVTLEQPQKMTAVWNNTPVTCFGQADGSINLRINGGTAPYTYQWNNGATTKDISGLSAGLYTVTVTDVNNCSITSSTVISQPDELTVAAEVIENDVILNVQGGTAPYIYQWSNGAVSRDLYDVEDGDYSVAITDSNGCMVSATAKVAYSNSCENLAAVLTPLHLTCASGNEGAINLTITGGSGVFRYEWSNGAVTEDLNNLAAGTYTVKIFDLQQPQCTLTESITLNAPEPLTVNPAITAVSCFGGQDGSVVLDVNGGTPPYAFEWSNGESNAEVSGLSAGNYSVVVRDANNCSVTRQVYLTEPTKIVAATNVFENDILLNVSGGTAPYTYLWSDGATLKDRNDLPAGPYSVTIKDAAGCSTNVSALIELDPCANLTATISPRQVSCSGNNGSIDLSVQGGSGNYSFLWNTGATTEDLVDLAPGAYNVTISDTEYNCTYTASATINAFEALTITAAEINPVTCAGQGDGSIRVLVRGGQAPYTYLWNNGATTGQVSQLQAGVYQVSVTDANQCQASLNISIPETAPLAATISKTDAQCATNCDGTATVQIVGGKAPYTYLWNNGSRTNSLSNLCAGTYSVEITDANQCTLVQYVVISGTQACVADQNLSLEAVCTDNMALTRGWRITNPNDVAVPASWSINGSNLQGTITASAKGATYFETPTQQGSNTMKLVINGNQQANVSSNNLNCGTCNLTATINLQEISCFGARDGVATVSVQNAQAPLRYQWSNGATTAAISSLSPGTYSVTVSDNRKCLVEAEVIITEPSPLSAAVNTISAATCAGEANGSAGLTIAGGTAPYTYQWSNGATTQDLDNAAPGTYTVAVRDARGCSTTATATIGATPAFSAVIAESKNISCAGGNNGLVRVSAQGGTAPYEYLWNTGATGASIAGLAAGEYSVTITDANQCTATNSVMLSAPEQLVVDLSGTDITCTGARDGAITAAVSGGVSPYTYRWNTSATTKDLQGLAAGTYTLTVTDANNCVQVRSVSLSETAPLAASLSSSPAGCEGSTGSIDLTVSGGAAPYTYLWSNGATTEDISQLSSGSYSVTATDANGCSITKETFLSNPSGFSAAVANSGNVSCFGESNGFVQLNVTGGIAPYTYTWSNGATTQNLANLPAGTYTVAVKDAKNCEATASVTLSQPQQLTVSVTGTNSSCAGAAGGTATAVVAGGTAPYQYAWSNGATVASLENLAAGTYQLLVRDANNCTTTSTLTISNPQPISAVANGTNVTCHGENNGTATVVAQGGTAPYTYLWNTGATTQSLTNLAAGNYSATITDANNCTTTANVVILQPVALAINFSQQIDVGCEGAANGGINVALTGGTAPFTFQWSNGATSQNQSNLAAGNYSLTVTDAKGCSATKTVELGAPNALSATAVASAITCSGGAAGAITLTVSGGKAPYTYLWSNGQTSQNLADLAPGTYSVTVRDANNCTAKAQANIAAAQEFTLSLAVSRPLSCDEAIDGGLSSSISGATAPYTYQWSNGATTSHLENVTAGTYSLTVTDVNGCQKTESISLNGPGTSCGGCVLALNFTPKPVSCGGTLDGSAVLNVIGGSGSFRYLWSNGTTTKNLNNVAKGTYTVTVTDNGNPACTQTGSVTIGETPLLNVSVGASSLSICGGTPVTLTAQGSTGTYLWYPYGETTRSITVTSPGNYYVVVNNGSCEVQSEVQAVHYQPEELRIYASKTSFCAGNDNNVQLTSSMSTGNIWSTGETTRSIFVKDPGTYNLTAQLPGCGVLQTSIAITLKTPEECGETEDPLCAPIKFPVLTIEQECQKFSTDLIVQNARYKYEAYLKRQREEFQMNYVAHCMDFSENFTMSYEDKEHHYTLYYYDQAGNLVRTVPPAGVDIIRDKATLDQVKADRAAGTKTIFTEHEMATSYTYNSLNQLVTQDMPDHQQLEIKELSDISNGIPGNITVSTSQFRDPMNGYLIGNDGTEGFIYTTDNGGESWSKLSSVGIKDLNAVQLVSGSNVAYAVGEKGTLLKSTDEGNNWLLKPMPTLGNLSHLYFFNSLDGLIFESNGKIWETFDGGESLNWVENNSLRAILRGTLTGIAFNGDLIIASSQSGNFGYLYRSIDGGISWGRTETIHSSNLNAVHFFNNQIGFAAGQDGRLLKTTNKGNSWQIIPTGFSVDFKNIQFSNASTGFGMTTTGQFYKTTNGGTTWSNLTAPAGTQAFYFSSASQGYAGGSGFHKTINGGSTWTAVTSSNLPTGGITAIYFSDADNGIVLLDNGSIYTTSNASAATVNWSIIYNNASNPIRSVSFISSSIGYALNQTGDLLKTTNGGSTWTKQSDAPASGLTGISFATASEGYLAGQDGKLFTTINGGTSWTEVSNSLLSLPLKAVALSGATAYAAGDGGLVLKSLNGGGSWQQLKSGTSNDLLSVSTTNGTAVAVGGKDGLVLKSTNGGAAFASSAAGTVDLLHAANNGTVTYFSGEDYSIADESGQLRTTPEAPDDLSGIAFKAASPVGLAVGEKGKIAKTNNGGTTWGKTAEIEPQVLYATHQVTSQVGYAVGKEGTILKTSNGGGNWDAIQTTFVQDLYGVHFINANIGIAVGNAGTLLRTTNGGNDSFTKLTLPTTANWSDVHFSKDGKLGVVVGSGGAILTSVNQGASWQQQASNTAANLKAVYVIDPSTVYAVGAQGTILRGTDKGENWEVLRQTNGANWTAANLNDVYFKDHVTGYVVGENGTVLKTVTRGETWEAETGQGNTSLIAIQPQEDNTVVITGGNGSVIRYQDETDQFGTRFFYDKLGRLVISQNAKQFNKAISAYSYTLYDALGRISEVGEVETATGTSGLKDSNGQIDQEKLNAWLTGGAKSQMTRTYYDVPAFEVPGLTQKNLRNRVVSTTYQAVAGEAYDHATHYTYDIHGNVETLIQDNPKLAEQTGLADQRYKRIDYRYDLVSGNVNEVHYQQGAPDQFYHRYAYDADNRITEVYTSSDYLIWDKDANYQYYQHGPLARMELGEHAVQGVDYAYTIQGWIKGVNSTSLNTAKDLGKDGTTGSKVAKDEFGYSLSYFDGDYSAINAPQNDLQVSVGNNLYNGNIRNMTTSIRSLMQNGASQTMAYQYDQLNRLVKADAYNLLNGSLTAKNDYKASYSYDANGNLLQLNRNAYGAGANSAGTGMDEFEYIYENKENGYERETNKLKAVIDHNNTTVEYGDLKKGQDYDAANPVVDNYQYDEIGNLIKDQQEEVTHIEWTVYGKIAKVEKTDGTILSFAYDATGNRISKREQGNGQDRTTYYVRDASGNVMANYVKDNEGLKLTEQPIYGSDRIGQRQETLILAGASSLNEIKRHSVGLKVFELKNHLGNVLTTVSDRKDKDGNAVVLSASDYYPFGMQMPNVDNVTGYRYGFNGKEKDAEGLGGGGSTYDYGFRIYNPGIGKFLSVDPLTKSYPMLTPYQFASNRPIDGIDLDGLEFSKSTLFDEKTGITHIKITVKVKVIVDPEINDTELVEIYKSEAKSQFSQVLGAVFDPVKNIQYSGELVYSDDATITYSIDTPVLRENEGDLVSVGISGPGYVGTAIGVIEGKGGKTNLFTPREYANTVVHELLHQGGVKHPTEKNAAEDVKLIKLMPPRLPNSYNTNILTTKDIYNNIMLYNFYIVDDKYVEDVRGGEENADKATPGQIDVINQNIDEGRVNGEPVYDE